MCVCVCVCVCFGGGAGLGDMHVHTAYVRIGMDVQLKCPCPPPRVCVVCVRAGSTGQRRRAFARSEPRVAPHAQVLPTDGGRAGQGQDTAAAQETRETTEGHERQSQGAVEGGGEVVIGFLFWCCLVLTWPVFASLALHRLVSSGVGLGLLVLPCLLLSYLVFSGIALP